MAVETGSDSVTPPPQSGPRSNRADLRGRLDEIMGSLEFQTEDRYVDKTDPYMRSLIWNVASLAEAVCLIGTAILQENDT